MPRPPSGTLTFLFTDIEGSTRLWEQHTAAMQAALARHDQILRHAIESNAGYVFKTVGDAFCAAFETALDCLRAALEAQLALAAEQWQVPGGIRVRMGFHTGTAEERDCDYFGQTLNRTARLQGVGYGGQVLVSLVSAELLRDILPEGVTLRDIGEHRLKDLMRPERVFQVCHPGLRAEFPPLKTLDNHPNNLPLQPTPFLGREKELVTAAEILRGEAVRILTFTGPGGTGKTRLALQVAAEASDRFDDGLFFIDLSSVESPNLIVPTVIRALEIRESGGRTAIEMLRDFTHHRRILLILDNLEQISGGVPSVVEILEACPSVKLLVTSREALHLRGEQVFPVPPLSTPAIRGASRIELAHLHQFEAVTLFIERARAVRPDFEATSENAPAIAEICARLDGLPLAIELAAARVTMLTPRAILSRLGRRLALLSGGLEDLPQRQRTLRGAIDWSYRLLAPREQALLREMAVFAGGASLEAAEEVCACTEDGASSVFDTLSALVAKSLVCREERLGEPRFTMLESIREYALELLEKAGGADALREAHASRFLREAERGGEPPDDGERGRALDRLGADVDNYERALDWLLASSRCDEALRLCARLGLFWRTRGHLSEGLAYARRALEACGEAAPRQAALLGIAGGLSYDQGDYPSAVAYHQERRAVCERAGDQTGAARASIDLGDALRCAGEAARAREILTAALAAASDELVRAELENNLGLLDLQEGRLDEAGAELERSRHSLAHLGKTYLAALATCNLGIIHEQQGRLDMARACYLEARDALAAVDDKTALIVLQNNLAVLYQKGREFREALACYQGMRQAAAELGNRRMVVFADAGIADALAGLGEAEKALQSAERALTAARDFGPSLELGVGLRARGKAELMSGHEVEAIACFDECMPLLERFGDREGAEEAREDRARAEKKRRTE